MLSPIGNYEFLKKTNSLARNERTSLLSMNERGQDAKHVRKQNVVKVEKQKAEKNARHAIPCQCLKPPESAQFCHL